MNFTDMQLKTKIGGMLAILLTLMLVVAGIGITRMQNIGDEIEAMAEEQIPMNTFITQAAENQMEQAILVSSPKIKVT